MIKTYLRILSYAGPLKWLLVLYLLATTLGTFFGLVNLSMLIPVLKVLFGQDDLRAAVVAASQPTFSLTLNYLKEVFNYHLISMITSHGRISALYFVCLAIVLSMLLSNLFRYLAEVITAGLRVHVVHHLRQTLFDKVSRLHMGYFHEQHSGEVMARLMGDVQEVEHAMAYMLRVFLKDPITIGGYFTVLFYMAPELAWLVLLLLPIVGGGVGWLLRRVLQRATQSQAALGKLTSIIEESMEGMKVSQALTTRPYIAARFRQENNHYKRLSFSMLRKNSLVPLLSEFLGVLVITLLLVYGGKMVLLQMSSLTASTFITYLIILAQSLVPVKSISKYLGNIQRGLAAGKRIFALIDTSPAIVSPPHPRTIQALQQGITFQNVSFTYGNKPILQHLNLTIKAGKKTALVGLSGSGKSTLIHLLNRYYDVTEGVIQIDDHPIQDYDLKALHRVIGLIPPMPVLFHDTVLNNITLGRPGASEEAVVEAARLAQAHDFIQALPQGYQTVIGTGGRGLSSGQKQQIGIARAVLERPSVLIMDEATSALDSATAQQVQANIDQLMQSKTSLVVAHRLATIQNADEILVMEACVVVEQGTHEALLRQGGLYHKLSLLHQKEG
ncbi:MAG: ABC transporter ATP-binding protein [Bacteroidota bacterium]